ncbi:MAG TPA: class I SAM-dependent methyltransferase [Acholeplasmataceae bacterium]|nr:class I SAM-dependent methyltransferase [Acholeplasmataceae bacterium]
MYQSIARYYDLIFPVDENKVSFLKHHFRSLKTILDVGCATGGYVQRLSGEGFICSGIDIDFEMIKIAKEKYPNLDFKQKSMLELGDEKYDGIYCIGNTLVHVEEVEKVINLMHKSLNKNGILIIQILNYDRILKNKIKSLPTINNCLTFTRNYEYDENKIIFKTEVTYENIKIKNSTTLYPIKTSDIKNILNKYFENVKLYHGFTDKPFNIEESFALVIVAN